ncbi:hypothetical protein G6656_00475 [Polynucleobacter paneuropaeus]|nr:hypothetical protein [Polynucleobacter paneuropaeus]
MKRLFIFTLFLLALSGCDNKNYPRVEILTGNSGILKRDDDGKLALTTAKNIPYKVGTTYYWRIAYRSNLPVISYIQDVQLAGKGSWKFKDTDKYEISDGGANVKIYKDDKKNDGFLFGSWTISDDDPAGKVTIAVTIEKDAKKIFEYELIKDEK